jgi:hypothetical protein
MGHELFGRNSYWKYVGYANIARNIYICKNLTKTENKFQVFVFYYADISPYHDWLGFNFCNVV